MKIVTYIVQYVDMDSSMDKMVAHLGLRTNELLYEESLPKFDQPERKQNVTKR